MEINLKIESYTVLSILILFSGIFREYVYYKMFGISILPYLEPTEAILLFFDIILYFSIFLIGNLFIVLIFHKKLLAPHLDFTVRESFKRNFGRLLKGLLFVLLSFALIIINSQINYFNHKELIYWLILLFIGFYINPFALMLTSSLPRASKSVKKILILLLITSNICVFASLSGKNEAEKVRNGYYHGSEFYGEKLILRSDSSNYFIGKTRQYYLFFKSKSNEVIIYPKELITEIRMK